MTRAEDGSWGLGTLAYAPTTASVVEHLASQLVGEDCLATDRAADICVPDDQALRHDRAGLVCYQWDRSGAWDLKGKLLGATRLPCWAVHRKRIFCYATSNDVDWYKELGFKGFKLACPYGPADGWKGIQRNEAFVAEAREIIGDEAELMLDCWMAFDVEYTVRTCADVRPTVSVEMEECLIPRDFDAHRAAAASALADVGDQ